MDYQLLADLLFPDVTMTPEDVEAKYPPRDLPEGAKVSVKNQELAVNFSTGKNEGARDLPVQFETRQLDDEDTWFYVI